MTQRLRGTVVLGLGVTGYSCVRYLKATAPHHALAVVDTRAAPPNLEAARREFPDVDFRCGDVDPSILATAEQIVVSPGIALGSCVLAEARRAGVPLTSDIALFLDAARAPVVAITGTNGKSTVTALAGHLLAAAGLDVGVGGNLGEPALDLLDDARDAYVLELSSFQLERLERVGVDAACILNVTPDHLDRYADLAGYAAAKQRVFTDCRIAVFNRHDPATFPVAPVGEAVSIGLDAPLDGNWGIVEVNRERHFARGRDRVAPVDATRLRGRHNELNVLAALALVATRVSVDPRVLAALGTFTGLPHRCVVVDEVAGVTWIDDSKATNLGACIAALEGLGDADRRHIVLLAGGDAKGIDLSPLGELARRFVRHVVTLGRDAARVEAAVSAAVPVTRAETMDQAVEVARGVARPGDIVLLSPACSSLDMFRDFAARGAAFAAAVRRIPR